MAITDLTDTIWKVLSGWSCSAGYGQFHINAMVDSHSIAGTFNIGYADGDSSNDASVSVSLANTISFWERTGGQLRLTPQDTFNIVIQGGEDSTNINLISWLSKNAILIKDIDIKYNNSIIATVKKGQKAVLQCQNKKLLTDIIITFGMTGLIAYNGKIIEVPIGQKAILTCEEQQARSDIVITSVQEGESGD